ncbi:unnamed protein product, partial [Mesorhabditis belari]|uniref:Atos-like conserved domain-containing protein n=1 Tax=Mesorhabditis belari TaxID=2138241 RepID=A0AAF3FCY9_9BILA
MTTASALDTCISIARIIAEARRFVKWSTLEACVRRKLANSSALCIFVRSSHKECGERCANSQPLEIWTIKCIPQTASGQMEIDGFFLASAIRSQLHFSPLQSWVARNQLPAGVDLITSIVNLETIEEIIETLPYLHQFPPTKQIDEIQCLVSVRYVRSTAMPKPLDMCSLLIETTLTGSSSNTPSGSPIDAPVFPLTIAMQNLSLENSIGKPKLVTPTKPKLVTPTTTMGNLQIYVQQCNSRTIARPDSLSLLATPTDGSAARKEKENSSEARRILFSDVLEVTSPRPLPSPFGRLLQVDEHQKEKEPTSNNIVDPRMSRPAQRSPFFNRIGLPIYSSPAPPIELKRRRARNSICLDGTTESGERNESIRLATSAPTSRSLLCNFEESALHCRLDPLAEVHGFTGHLVASNGPIPSLDLRLPVRTFFFDNGNDSAPSPYLGVCSLSETTKRGLVIPPTGTLQFTLLNPQGTVVRMFVQRYNFADLRPAALTFLRQRTFFMRENGGNDSEESRKLLRYLIHFKLRTDKSGRLRLHSDIRMLFAPNNTIDALNIEPVDGNPYVFRSFTETPRLPKTSLSESSS